MGNTSKIIYSSVLAILVVSLFLIFYMQKSAQLVLDKKAIEQTVIKNEQTIATIQQTLDETTALVESTKKKNSEISNTLPELTNSIATLETEKAGLVQNLKELQGKLEEQLAIANKELAKFNQLSKQSEEQQSQLAIAETQNITASENLNATQATLDNKKEALQQLTAELKEKNQAITFYSEKLEASADILRIAETAHATKAMNLTLVLDELAVKTKLLARLQDKIAQLSGNPAYSEPPSSSQNNSSIVSEVNALIEQMNRDNATSRNKKLPQAMIQIKELEINNSTLQANINEQSARIQGLLGELQNKEQAFTSEQAKHQQQQIDNHALNEELEKLRIIEVEANQALAQMKAFLTDKENELAQNITQNEENNAALTEKITALELQIREAMESNSALTENITKKETNLNELQTTNESLNSELVPAKSALENALAELTQLTAEMETTKLTLQESSQENSSLSAKAAETLTELTQAKEQAEILTAQFSELQENSAQQAQEIISLQDSFDTQTTAITTAKSELDVKIASAEISLHIAQEESNTLKEQLDASMAAVTEKDAAIQELTTQVTADNSVELEQKIAQLMEEAVTVKTTADAQVEEITGLMTAKDAAAQELSDSQNQISTLQGTVTALTAERDQLLLMTTDSDNDGVSDAKDTCPETIEGAKVNEQGCEEDSDNDGLVNSLDLCPDTATDAATDKAGCADDQTTVVLDGINFQLGTAELAESAHDSLNITANILQKNPSLNMEIAGHTDSIGEAESNLQLSTIRAESVLKYLVARGVSADRLQAQGYGATNPIADNATDAGRSKNRRVELRRTETSEEASTETEQPKETTE